jgi:hypothetical protein
MYWKNINRSEKLKNEAAEEFKLNNIEVALAKYDECLLFDPLNNSFNMTILYNKACALSKINKNDEALYILT